MAKITRYGGNLKAFAADATGTERTVFGDVTQSDTLDANVNADWLRGWGIIGVNEAPTKQDFNGMAFALGQLIAYLHQTGVPEWHTSQEYHTDSLTNRNGVLYFSTIDDNIGFDPELSVGGKWILLSAANLGYDHSTSGLVAELVQGAIDELAEMIGAVSDISDVSVSVVSNALAITINAQEIQFRSTDPAYGTPFHRSMSANASMFVPDGATLGTVSGVKSRLVVLAIDNAGTVEAAIINLAGGVSLDETGFIGTTAIDTTADAANVAYSNTARSNVAYRVMGVIDITEATAGTWATAPTLVQGEGGQSLGAMATLGYGQTWQNVTRAPGNTYYNDKGKPIGLVVDATASSLNLAISIDIVINGTTLPLARDNGATDSTSIATGFMIIPPGAAYSVTHSGVGVYQYSELR